jgi:ABC-type multidrug transport system fused ATPase/permease subunit
VIFFRLLAFARPHLWRLALTFVVALCGVGLELARPWPIKLVIDSVIGSQPLPSWLGRLLAGWPGASSPSARLMYAVAAAVLIVLLASVVSLVVLRSIVRIAQRMVFDLSRLLFSRLQRLSLAYHGRHTVGDLLQRTSQDVFVAHFAVSQVAIPGLASLITLLAMFGIMLRLDPTLAVVAISAVPFLIAALVLFTRPLNDATTVQYTVQGRMMAFLEQSLSGIKVIQGFARERYVEDRLELEARQLGHAYNRLAWVQGGYKESTAIVTGIAAAVVLGMGGLRVLDGRLTLGDLLVFLGYLSGLTAPVTMLSAAVGAAVVVSARGRRVFEVLESGEQVAERPGAVPPAEILGEVTFEHVTFGYGGTAGAPTGEPVLSGISFQAAPGQVTAIVGATGAGKSSLMSLLPRFYDPWAGRILLDGHDLRDLPLSFLRERVALVLQDTFVFPMTVADNIGFGRPGATRGEIEEAARIAHAHGFISRLPDGYDTILGEKGAALSGGERQRLALARALLKNAPILVLDEPTSALDARTEAQIFEAMGVLMRNRTTFVISHRLSTIRRADQIFALDGGRLAESGTHESLLALGGVYANLYRHQHLAAL